MYLKSLKLVGFKSFADRTHLELRPGVTVIVGPNGSGKSNLVDALSWVMGTQSPRTLRTSKMEDVVFAGTATRPALNRAEVTLLIDNAERRLPLDLPEVALTRRLYRDGSSDYEINGAACRLLDIEELLSDSGVGRHQHVIIGQGEIGTILSASPEEHRAVIEEAAGILKHRRRKERAERRLERTDDDLLRLQDLVAEIERQLRPLRRQARAVERYEGLRTEVRELLLYLGRIRLERNQSETAELEAERDTSLATLSEADEQASSALADLSRLEKRASTVGAELDRDTAAAARLETTIERLRRLGSVAHERIRAASDRREVTAGRRADLEAELAMITEEIESVTPAAIETAAEAASREEEFRRLEDEERAIATQTSLSPEGAAAAARGELSVLEAATLRETRESEAVAERIRVLEAQLAAESAEIVRMNNEVRDTDERLSTESAVYESAIHTRERDQQRWTSAEDLVSAARLDQAAAQARVDAISAALQGSFDMGARARVEDAPGSLGSLISLLDVPRDLERAAEAALGAWASSIVFSTSVELTKAVESVRGSGTGGIPLVYPDGIAPCPARETASEMGVEALIDRLGPDANEGLAARLLGDVLVAEGWATAWELVSRNPTIKAVTPEGDVVTSFGIQIAHPDGIGPAMLESSEVALERAGTELARANSILTTAKRDFDKSREVERAALETVEQLEATLAGKTEAMASLQRSEDVLTGEHQRLEQRRSSLAAGIAQRSAQMEALRQRLAAFDGEEAARVRAWEEMEARRVDLAATRETARSRWQQASATSHSIAERRRLLDERSARIGTELTRLGSPGPEQVDISLLESVEGYARRSVEVLSGRLRLLRERQAKLRGEKAAVLELLSRTRAEYEQTRSSIGDGRQRLGEIEVRLTTLRLQRESLGESLRRDADADLEDARSAMPPDYPEDADLTALFEEKNAQLRRLGPINPLAAAEFAEMSARHEFITTQVADVESSRFELRKVISALESEIEARFATAFQEVAEAYQRYFSILFPGGRGRIRMTDADDPHAGLLIDAQPAGKKVTHMTLLSGGERSLAALAFLFSVFETRPSPFYVLDEVEAALDDANLRRFLRIVDEFRTRAQVVIITHQQQTMEVADVLYGVTMEPGGSSKVIRKEMSAIGADRVA